MNTSAMPQNWAPEDGDRYREAERHAAEAMRSAYARSRQDAPQPAPQPTAPPQSTRQTPPPQPPVRQTPPRAPDPDPDQNEEAWRVHSDDEDRFSPPPQNKQRLPVDGETLLVAALLYILWTQDADRELLVALAYILL